MRKIFFYVILIASLFLVLVIIWPNYHSGQHLGELESAVDTLFSTGLKQSDSPAKASIAVVRRTIAGSEFARVPPAFRTVFESYLKEWGSGGLTETVVNNYRPQLEAQFRAYEHLKYNQLLAILLDWGIWMISLGLCLFSDVLRDLTGDMSKLPKGSEPPFSLGRTQLVVWITIIASVYTYAVLWDGKSLSIINTTALILMGISLGEFTAGAFVDTMEIQQGVPRIQDQASSGNFFEDILSDGRGVSIHRVQNFIWTLVAVVIYFYRYSNPPANEASGLPVLDPTLLALTGISGLTYLTLKTRENPQPNPVKIALALSPTSTLSADEKAALTSKGFPNATVDIIDPSNKLVHANGDPANANFNFIASNIPPGNWTVKGNWTGAPISGGSTHTLTGTWTGQVTNATGSLVLNLG